MTGGSRREIRAVFFDLDDTLFAHRESVVQGITSWRQALGGAVAEADAASEAARWNALEEQHYHRFLAGELDFLGQRRARARGFMEPFGGELSDVEAEKWFEDYLEHYESTWRLHDDVAACLDAVAPRPVGLITNGEFRFQAEKVTRTGLDRRIPLADMVASGDVGVAKPDPAIFAAAAAHVGLPASVICYVGDRLRTDAIGAAHAGLLGVWIDRPGTATPEQRAEAAAAGVPVIRTLDELPALLG